MKQILKMFTSTVSSMKRIFCFVDRPVFYLLMTVLFSTNSLFNNLFIATLQHDVLEAIMSEGIGLFPRIWRFALILVGYLLLLGFSTYGSNVAILHAERSIMSKMLHCLLQRDLSSAQMHSGEIMTRLNQDVFEVISMIGPNLMSILTPFITGVGCLLAIAAINTKMTLFCIGVGILSLISHTLFARSVKKVSGKIQHLLGESNIFIADAVSASVVLRATNGEPLMVDGYRKKVREIKDQSMIRVKISIGQLLLKTLSNWLSYAGAVILGYIFLARDEVTLPALIMMPTLCGGVVSLFTELGGAFARLQRSAPGVERVLALFDIPQEKAGGVAVDASRLHADTVPHIRLSNITYRYNNNHEDTLRNLQASISPREIVALIGPSGSGKSTVLKLIAGLLPIQGGDLYFDDRSIRDISFMQRGRLSAYVPQDNPLVMGSYRENIKMGNLQADDAQMEHAAYQANADKFIMADKDGYDADVGIGLASMSGGERQRVAIARALLTGAPVILLDEPSSALDALTEAQIKQTIIEISQHATVIFSSHRESLAECATQVFFLDK